MSCFDIISFIMMSALREYLSAAADAIVNFLAMMISGVTACLTVALDTAAAVDMVAISAFLSAILETIQKFLEPFIVMAFDKMVYVYNGAVDAFSQVWHIAAPILSSIADFCGMIMSSIGNRVVLVRENPEIVINPTVAAWHKGVDSFCAGLSFLGNYLALVWKNREVVVQPIKAVVGTVISKLGNVVAYIYVNATLEAVVITWFFTSILIAMAFLGCAVYCVVREANKHQAVQSNENNNNATSRRGSGAVAAKPAKKVTKEMAALDKWSREIKQLKTTGLTMDKDQIDDAVEPIVLALESFKCQDGSKAFDRCGKLLDQIQGVSTDLLKHARDVELEERAAKKNKKTKGSKKQNKVRL